MSAKRLDSFTMSERAWLSVEFFNLFKWTKFSWFCTYRKSVWIKLVMLRLIRGIFSPQFADLAEEHYSLQWHSRPINKSWAWIQVQNHIAWQYKMTWLTCWTNRNVAQEIIIIYILLADLWTVWCRDLHLVAENDHQSILQSKMFFFKFFVWIMHKHCTEVWGGIYVLKFKQEIICHKKCRDFSLHDVTLH